MEERKIDEMFNCIAHMRGSNMTILYFKILVLAFAATIMATIAFTAIIIIGAVKRYCY